jgi:hypothetical protein
MRLDRRKCAFPHLCDWAAPERDSDGEPSEMALKRCQYDLEPNRQTALPPRSEQPYDPCGDTGSP